MRRATLALLVFVAAGCQRGQSYILVESSGHAALGTTSLHLDLANAGQTASLDVTPTVDPFSFSLAFDPDRTGVVDLTVEARAGGATLATRTQHPVLDPGGTVTVMVTFGTAVTDGGSDGSILPDAATARDLAGLDLTALPDQSSPIDLTVLPDQSSDLRSPDDMTMASDLRMPDMTPPPDLKIPSDMTSPNDLAPPPDLQPPPDMSLLPDLGGPRCVALQGAGAPMNNVVTAPSVAFDLGGSFTVEAWVYPLGISGGQGAGLIFHGGIPAMNGYDLELIPGTTTPVLHVFSAVNGDTTIPGSVSLTPNTWNHVAGVYDGANITVWVGGMTSVPKPVNGAIKYGQPGPLVFGDRFAGYIDEVRVSRGARYSGMGPFVPAQTFVVDGNTVALYHLDALGSLTATDATGAHDGTLMGGVVQGVSPCN